MSNQSEYHVFIVHNNNDKLDVEEIAQNLQKKFGIRPWLHSWSVTPGQKVLKEYEKGLEQAQASAVFIGGERLEKLQELAVYSSLQKHTEEMQSQFPVIPVYMPNSSADINVSTIPWLKLYEPVKFVDLNDEDALHRLACGISGQPPGKQEPIDLPCPFPGLEPFKGNMSQYFFGREEEVEQLLKLFDISPFIVVIGPSGSGKSSFIRAGLLPKLNSSSYRQSNYPVYILHPGSEPLQNLAMMFVEPEDIAHRNQLAENFAKDEQELARIIRAKLRQMPDDAEQALFVIDQFEEIFTLCSDPKQQDAFINSLLYACTATDNPVKVIFTLRSDFYTPCFKYPRLVESRYHFPIQPLRGDVLWKAIEKVRIPAGLIYQPGLIKAIVDEAGNEPGILPLVQYTLLQLFERRNGRWLTFDAYHALGSDIDQELSGVRGVITSQAENALRKLKQSPRFSPELAKKQAESVMRRIFLRLIQASENSPPTRQEVDRRQFFWDSDTDEERVLIEEGLELLLKERLLIGDENRINLAHEVIIGAWKRLADWVDDSEHNLLIRRRVEESANTWLNSGRDESVLYRGKQLSDALRWQQEDRI